jgi:DNA-binding YbaB/EbfC family protein
MKPQTTRIDVKDFGALMKQAQAMQEKLQQAQARLAELSVEGTSGGGMVKVTLKGSGELTRVDLDESLMAPGEGEVVADLIVAAHADAKRKLDAAQGDMMREAAGPLAGMNLPGMPKF